MFKGRCREHRSTWHRNIGKSTNVLLPVHPVGISNSWHGFNLFQAAQSNTKRWLIVPLARSRLTL
jgi:hypothetical protein